MMPPPQLFETCLALIARASIESRNGHYAEANQALAAAVLSAQDMPQEWVPDLRAAFLYGTLLVQSRKAPASVTPEIRAKAAALLNQSKASAGFALYQALMFDLLTGCNEYRLAIPFAERSLTLAEQDKEPAAVADWLRKLGNCYSKTGLRDHATIAYRASVKIFRQETGDPRLPAVLLALGNAIRKSEPAEAEALYREAAALWESKGHLESATPAWSNLGILCSDGGRFEEALDYYDRVRRVRESAPGTSAAALGRLYNNLASCYRKMKRFSEAHQTADRAIAILSQPGIPAAEASSFASAIGTKGMILRDEGHDLVSIEFFQRARSIFESQSAPNLENVIEELEHEAAALTRLNRTAEAEAIQQKVDSLRKAAAEVPRPAEESGTPAKLHEGVLLIELNRGLRNSDEMEILALGQSFKEILVDQRLGEWQGSIRIPESSTLIYYGPDAESIYSALESSLLNDRRCEGAQITIRQSSAVRQFILPSRMVQ